jgi:hypothetical protein
MAVRIRHTPDTDALWTGGRTAPCLCELFPFAQLESQYNKVHASAFLSSTLLSSALMFHSHLTASSTSNFQLIINNALKAYEKRTRRDLSAHPLAAQLQACDSLCAILAVFQQQVQGIDQSRSDVQWTKWLYPTVDVLFALSSTLGTGVGVVCPRTCRYLRSAFSYYLFGRYSNP